MANSNDNKKIVNKLIQIGFIVPNLDECLKNWEHLSGIEWSKWRVGGEFTSEYIEDGKPRKEYNTRYAIGMLGDVQLEMIEPQGDDNGYYSDFLKQCGPGVQHLLVEQGPGFEDFIKENNIKELNSFRISRHGKKIAYYDTREMLGVILEVYVKE